MLAFTFNLSLVLLMKVLVIKKRIRKKYIKVGSWAYSGFSIKEGSKGFKSSQHYGTHIKIGRYTQLDKMITTTSKYWTETSCHSMAPFWFLCCFFLTNLETSGSRIPAEYDAIHTKSHHIKTYRNKLPIS